MPPAPPRPQGVERNLVLTQWEWTDEMGKIHDEASTDKRNPHVNANGPIYGVDIANDNLAMLDPATHTATMVRIPTLADRSTMRASYAQSGYPASRLADIARFNPASIHNPMLDSRGRVWYTATVPFRLPWPVRLAPAVPLLRDFPGWLVGWGIRPERLRQAAERRVAPTAGWEK